ncbi:hypothetical protein C8J56DRAFT_1066728 [Mycena floridula]|nr:hypothetical protein C8J56DRAFT_1066728 [Mycena floridula]
MPRAKSSSPDFSPPYCRPRINSTDPGVLKGSSRGIPSSPHASAPSSPCPARPDLMVPLISIHDNREIDSGISNPGNGLFNPTNSSFESYIPQEFVELLDLPCEPSPNRPFGRDPRPPVYEYLSMMEKLPQYLRDTQAIGPDWVKDLTLSSLHVSPMTLQTRTSIKTALEHHRLEQLYWDLKNITNLSLREITPFEHESERLSMAVRNTTELLWERLEDLSEEQEVAASLTHDVDEVLPREQTQARSVYAKLSGARQTHLRQSSSFTPVKATTNYVSHWDAISSRKVGTSDLKTRVKSCLGYMLDVSAQEVPHWDLTILGLLDPTTVDEKDLLNAVTEYMKTFSTEAQPRIGRRIDDLLTRCDESGRAECVDARIHQLIAIMKAALEGSRGLIVWK